MSSKVALRRTTAGREEASISEVIRRCIPWIIVGLAVRFALAPFTSHPFDMSAWISHQDRLFNAGLNPLFNWKFSLPVMALLLATFFPAMLTTMAGIPATLSQQLWIKTPAILADVGIAFALAMLLLGLKRSEREARLAAIVWLLNPVSMFFTAVHGQLDTIPTFLLMLGLAFAQLQRAGNAIASLAGAGIAKFFGFLIVPLFWMAHRVSRRTVFVQSLVLVIVGLIAFGVLVLLPLRFGSGISSSLWGTGGAALGHASVWSMGWLPPDTLRLLWPSLFLAFYVNVLWALRRTPQQVNSAIPLLAGTAAVLVFLIAIDPYANPQFFVWVMPVLLALAFSVGDFRLLIATFIVGLLDLVAFWRNVDPFAWFLNAVPDVHEHAADVVLPAGLTSSAEGRLLGFVYGVTLIGLAIWSLVLMNRGRVPARAQRTHIVVPRALAAGSGLLCLAFVGVTFQPALVQRYGEAPEIPFDLVRINTFPASTVRLLPESAYAVEARWDPSVIAFANGAPDRSALEIESPSPLPPVIDEQLAQYAIPVTSQGLVQEFTTSSEASLIRVRVLLNHTGSGSILPTDLPDIDLSAQGSRQTRSLETTQVVEGSTSPDWFIVRIDQSEPHSARSYELRIAAPRSSGWSWNAGSLESPVSGFLSNLGAGRGYWTRVWAVPTAVASGEEASPVLAPDDHLRIVSDPSGLLQRSMVVEVPANLQGARLPRVSIVLDLTERIRWRSDPWRAALLSLAAAASVALFSWLVVLLVRFSSRWSRT